MSSPLLQTKLHIPYDQLDKLLVRPRLNEQLTQGLLCKLTMVAAPAGFGKTTLVCNWLYHTKQEAAWFSLDEGDNDLTQFLRYMIAALRNAYPNIGEELAQRLERTRLETPEPLLTELISEIERASLLNASQTFILVLDDYHLITSDAIHGALRYLLDHLPRSLHLILTTRADPPLSLARLRVRQQLNEIRADALRFSPEELQTFFNKVMQMPLSTELMQQLADRTEGWIAGVQLASLTLQQLDAIEAAQFMTEFAGTDRYIADYLLDEVLEHQSDEIRMFLLQTSILNRLSPDLCDALVDHDNSHNLLRQLEAGNFFLIRLDNRRQWYRYHHLFQDLLQAQLSFQQPGLIPKLHRRACDWYAANDLTADALEHALAAEDFTRAAELIELSWRTMDRTFQSATWLSWVKKLPEAMVAARPVLSTGYGWGLLDIGEIEAAEPHLRTAEQWLGIDVDAESRAAASSTQDDGTMVVVDEVEFDSLPATLAAARAYGAQARGDLPATKRFAQQALDLLPEDDYFYRGIPVVTLGMAYLTNGELEAAFRAFTRAESSFQQASNFLFIVSAKYMQGEIKAAQGHLYEALHILQQTVDEIGEHYASMPMFVANLHRGMSEVYQAQGDLESASEQLRRYRELGKLAMQQNLSFRFHIAEGLLKQSQQDLDGALDHFDEAARVYKRERIPNFRPMAALKARVWIKQGRLAEASAWVREYSISTDDELSYLREFEMITLARVLIAQHQNAHEAASTALDEAGNSSVVQAIELLQRLSKTAEAGARLGTQIEIHLLQALAYETQGDTTRALEFLQSALILAQQEGYIQIFIDEGQLLHKLLRKLLQSAAANDILPEFTNQLLASLDSAQTPQPEQAPSAETAQSQPLVEPLSTRELEILHHVAAGKKNQEIADELFISLNTVRYHTKNLYGKLDVNKRTQAVAKAQALGLLVV